MESDIVPMAPFCSNSLNQRDYCDWIEKVIGVSVISGWYIFGSLEYLLIKDIMRKNNVRVFEEIQNA